MKKIVTLFLAILMVVSILPVNAYAAAPGTLMSNAVELSFGTSYSKSWTKDTDHLNHYTTFTLNERGMVTLKVDKPFDSEGEYSRMDIVFYDEDGEPIMGSECYKTVDNAKSFYIVRCGLDAGTYYMTLKPGFYVISGVISVSYKIEFEADPYCEVEPNGDASSATLMTLGKMYTGYFGSEGSDYEEYDYFKFKTEAGHNYRIRLKNYGKLEETTTLFYLSGKKSAHILSSMASNIDEDGYHYFDFNALASSTYYLYFDNYMGPQVEYGLEVIDLSAPSEPEVHEHSYTSKVTYPTCTTGGYTTYTCSCGDSYTGNETKALGHSYSGGSCSVCGAKDPDYVAPSSGEVARLAGSNRWATSLAVADQMKENLGLEKFNAIIIASGDNFADALAGSYLSAVKSAPILLCWNGGGRFEYLNQNILDYINNNLAAGGTVYILGGKGAVPMSFDEKLGSCVNRLNGSNRFETNLMILKEAGVKSGEEILVCTSTNFADSLSASATGKPILLVYNEGGKLFDNQKAYLSTLSGNTFTILGGVGAVSEKMAGLIGAYGTTTRLAGTSRFETSVMVALKYFDNPDSAVLAYAWNYPDGLCGGGLAYSMGAPLILTMTNYENRGAKDYIQNEGIEDAIILGGTGLISDGCVKNIFGKTPTTIG